MTVKNFTYTFEIKQILFLYEMFIIISVDSSIL